MHHRIPLYGCKALQLALRGCGKPAMRISSRPEHELIWGRGYWDLCTHLDHMSRPQTLIKLAAEMWRQSPHVERSGALLRR